MTYIIQNRIIRICENEKDYGEYIKELDLRKKESTNPLPSKTGKSSTSICMPWFSDDLLTCYRFNLVTGKKLLQFIPQSRTSGVFRS